jgi:hypothetical protein
MELWAVNDGDIEIQGIETYGYFRVTAPSMGHLDAEHCFFPEFGNCDNEPYWAGTRRYLLLADWETSELGWGTGGLVQYQSGTHELWREKLCQSSTKYSCEYEGQPTSYKLENNTIRVFIKEGDVLTFQVMLVDYDELSANDTICNFTGSPYPRELWQWKFYPEQTVWLGGVEGCTVIVKVEAVGDPVPLYNP